MDVYSISPSQFSGMIKDYICNIKKYTKDPKKVENIVGYTLVFIIFGAALALVISIIVNNEYWQTYPDTPEKIRTRVAQRGLIASAATVLVFGLVNGLMTFKSKVNPPTYQAFVGLILSGMLGFVMDNAIATEKGCSIFNGGGDNADISNLPAALSHGFSTLASSKLPRYIITIFLDIFISLILTDSLSYYCRNMPFFRNNRATTDIIIMAVVSFITFLAYANATRLEWAYPPTDSVYTKFEYIPTSTILLSTIISGLVFLIWSPMDQLPAGITKPFNKVIIMSILITVIIISYYGEWLDPVPDTEIVQTVQDGEVVNEIINNKPDNENLIGGLFIYIVLTIILTIITMLTSHYRFSNFWYGMTFAIIVIILIPVFIGSPSFSI